MTLLTVHFISKLFARYLRIQELFRVFSYSKASHIDSFNSQGSFTLASPSYMSSLSDSLALILRPYVRSLVIDRLVLEAPTFPGIRGEEWYFEGNLD